MMSIAEFATKRVVATTMIILFMVFSGIIAMFGMKQELLPNFDFPIVAVTTTWTGASPEDVDTQISKKIEDAVLNVDGIKNITMTSGLGYSAVIVEFDFGVDSDIKKVQVQSEIDKIKNTLPTDIDSPIVGSFNSGRGGDTVLLVNISGEDEVQLTTFAEDFIKPRLKRNKGIGEVKIIGGATREIRIKLDPYKLKSFGFSASEIYTSMKASNTVVPSGFIKDGGKEFLVRVLGEIKTIDEIENIILSNSNGQTLRLKDVSKVEYTTKDKEDFSKLNGKDAVSIAISKTSDGNLVEIADKAKDQLEEIKSFFPQGSSYEIIQDSSQNVKDSINNVASTGVQALILAVIVLMVFLKDIRATLVVALAVPISIAFTFFLLASQNVSLNLISLMGLSLGVGSLVDNSVVALDNIFRHMEENKEPPLVASIRGTNEVIVALVASTLTSVCVFFPIILKNGFAKEVFNDMSLAIIFSLSVSIIVAMLFVPMAASRFLNLEKILQKEQNAGFFNKVKEKYGEIIIRALKNRVKIIIGVVVLFFFTIIFVSPMIKTTFFPKIDNREYAVIAELSTGLDLNKSYEITKRIEKIVAEDKTTESFSSVVGKESSIVNVKLKGKESSFKVMERIRQKVKNIPDIKLNMSEQFTTSVAEKDYSFVVQGDNVLELDRISKNMIKELETTGVFKDIKSSYEGGNPQARIIVDRIKAESYNINVTDIATMLNMSILGIAPIEITEGNNNLDVTVQLDEQFKNSTDKILDLDIKNKDDVFVKLRDVAKIEEVEGPSSVAKKNGFQIVTVEANLSEGKGFNDASSAIDKAFKNVNPAKGYTIAPAGSADSFKEMGGDLANSLLLSIILIYTVLAIQLESFILPLVIMGTVPLSLIGVIFGLFITGTQLSMFVMIGVIMLMGIVVNNAIVLIDYIGLLRNKGMEIKEAIKMAGTTRLRPILMTTLTTVLGWIPLALGIGTGAGYYQGMSIAVIFGLSTSTLLTLIVIPLLYSIVEERKIERLNRKGKGHKLNLLFNKILKRK